MMKNLPIKGDKFRPEFLSEMTEVSTEGINSLEDAAVLISDTVITINALLLYYKNHDYSVEDVRQLRRMLAEISVYAQYAGNALADTERNLRKLE